jgi:hypothetical protein
MRTRGVKISRVITTLDLLLSANKDINALVRRLIFSLVQMKQDETSENKQHKYTYHCICNVPLAMLVHSCNLPGELSEITRNFPISLGNGWGNLLLLPRYTQWLLRRLHAYWPSVTITPYRSYLNAVTHRSLVSFQCFEPK